MALSRPAGAWRALRSAGPGLQGGPHAQEGCAGCLQQAEARGALRHQAEGAQQRDGAPHDGKGCGALDDRAAGFLGMEPAEQFCPLDRAAGSCL